MTNQIDSGTRVSKWQLIWTIASKDFVDGLKRRQMLTHAVTVIFLVLLYRFLPQLGNANSPPRLVVYDAGDSELIQDLERSEAVRLRQTTSYEDMLYQVGIEDGKTLGLVLPKVFDQLSQTNELIVLDAVIDHWVKTEDFNQMQTTIEAEITQLSDATVQLNIERQRITQADGAFAFHIALGLLVVMGLMGITVTPQLIVEEKTNRTIDALQVSPITMTELLAAKVLVGAVYCILMSSAVLIAYGTFVLHWWAMAGAILCAAFFNVSIGLLLGIKLKDVRQISLWTFIIFQPLIISMILGMFEPISAGLRSIMRWFPTVAMGNAAAQSLTDSVDVGSYLFSLSIMLAWGGLFFLIGSWLLQRSEQ